MICCLNGKFLSEKEAKISVLDHGFLYSDGFYDTMKAYNGVVLDVEAHLKRVERSLKAVDIKLPWSTVEIRKWIEKTARQNSMKLARVRMTITRGVNDFDFSNSRNPVLVIIAEPIEIEEKIYKGVPVITVNVQRTMPEIKTIGVTAMIVARRQLLENKAFEAFLVDDLGFVREGTVTNFFWVKNGILYTPKNKVLPGITRDEVKALCKKNGMKVVMQDVKLAELLKADEIFTTNTKFGIVPVLKLDAHIIGKGKIGKMTVQAMQLFNDFVNNYLVKQKKQ